MPRPSFTNVVPVILEHILAPKDTLLMFRTEREAKQWMKEADELLTLLERAGLPLEREQIDLRSSR
jgi:hypothetical protein